MPTKTSNTMKTQRAWMASRVLSGLAGIIGYILSPASWWNDAVVNIPLALLIAEALSLLGVPLEAGFIAAYWATNILGIILIAVGAEGLARSKVTRKSILAGVAIATLYTVAVVYLIELIK